MEDIAQEGWGGCSRTQKDMQSLMCVLNSRSLKYTKNHLKQLKGEINSQLGILALSIIKRTKNHTQLKEHKKSVKIKMI